MRNSFDKVSDRLAVPPHVPASKQGLDTGDAAFEALFLFKVPTLSWHPEGCTLPEAMAENWSRPVHRLQKALRGSIL